MLRYHKLSGISLRFDPLSRESDFSSLAVLPKDEIICLREGHVVERGSSKELMEQRGYFFTLVEKQAAS